ncbi:Uncharacterized protein Cadr_000016328 [Camelus dromedarius]|uniref:Uncharacterized protein n=1 Tax=Camelus dromedarius TaxID=9838 RepID=A0A5N4E9Q8_CAMDR|nr:Uncharacterized protein Cadr_000016328 [Camelus dromedarius]
MPRRHPRSWAQQVAPEGLPGDGVRRRKDPGLPRLLLPELRASSGVRGFSRGSRASGSGADWWEDAGCEASHLDPGVGVRRSRPRLPALPTLAQRAARNRTGLRPQLLPPLLWAREPQEPAPSRPGPGPCEDPRRGSAKEVPDSLSALVGELLPGRFREFLCQLGVQCTQQTKPPSEALLDLPGGGARAGLTQQGVTKNRTANRSTQELKGHLSEDTSMNSSLPFIPRATIPRQRGDLKTFLEQESFLPSLVLHTVLKRGHPKGYQLLLPSATSHRAQR